jgi:D-inositol-3-phosphate glycosyltransferase
VKNCIVGPAFPLRGGIANFNEALCRAFNQQGIESKLFSFSMQYPGFLFPGTSQFETGMNGPSDLTIVTCLNSLNPLTWFKVARKIKKEKPDYVIIRYWLPFMAPCLGTLARLIKYKTNIKVIAIADNVVPHEKRIGDAVLTKYFINACDAYLVMSKAVLHDLSLFTKSQNTAFIPHPIYSIFGPMVGKAEALHHLNLTPGKKYILFFGFIRNYKGLDLLLEAMANEKIKDLDVNLIVAGEFYEDPVHTLDLIEKYQLKDRLVLRTHYIPQEDVKYYFCAADLIAQPYLSATQSGVTQIAYHFERPMLVTNVGGLAEIVPHGKVGYVVEKKSDEVAAALVDFYENNREAAFSEATKTEKLKFSWEAMVEGIGNLFKQIETGEK